MTRPEEKLVDPQAEDPMPGLVSFIAGGNFVSPAYYISTTIKTLVGFDVYGWAGEKVNGDWESVAKAAGAAGNLSRFNSAYAESINTQWQQTAGATWHGHAADSSQTYFTHFAACVEFQVRPLEEIERQLTNISTGMRELGRRVGDFLQDISDLALLWLASQAAEAVLASSLVGAPAAAAQAAVSAAYLVQIVAKVGELIKLVTTAYKAIYGMIGLLNALSSQTTPENLPALPNSTYDHPGV